MKSHLYEADELVIGYGLNAVLYAYLNNSTILLNGDQRPFRFDTWEGKQKLDIWSEKLFALSISGKCPLSDKIKSIRVEDNQLSIATKNSRRVRFQYQKLRIFDADHVEGIELEEKVKEYRVFDWFDVFSGMRHIHDRIETTSDFVRWLHFYPSDRMHGKHLDKKDLVTESYIRSEHLDDFGNSSTAARLKSMATMKEHGIRGTRNGRSMEDPTKYKYYALKVEFSHREKYKHLKFFDAGDLPKSVKFDITYENDLLEQLEDSKYLLKAERKLLLGK
tara:strand:- start:541 stop:1371 length:831 start_codon:yes stop_codon:yes gene_type:complete